MTIDPRFHELLETSMRASRKKALRTIFITLLISVPLFIWTLTWIDPNTSFWGDKIEEWSYPATVLGWTLVIIGAQLFIMRKRFNLKGLMTAINNPESIVWIWEVSRKLGKKTGRVVHVGTNTGQMYRVKGELPWIKAFYAELVRVCPEAYRGYNFDFQKIFRKNPGEVKTYEVYREQRVKLERGEEISDSLDMELRF